MKPLVDISVALAKFDLKVSERMKVEAKLLSHDTTNNYVVVLAPPLTEFLTQGEEAKVLPKPDLPAHGRVGRGSPTAKASSMQHRLPVIVPAKSGIWLCAELEGPLDSTLDQS
jgi:hypothetical protein